MKLNEQFYLLNDNGKKSLSFSLVVYSFAVIIAWTIYYAIGCSLGLAVPIPAESIIAVFSFCCGLYGFRKHDKNKKKPAEEKEDGTQGV